MTTGIILVVAFFLRRPRAAGNYILLVVLYRGIVGKKSGYAE